MIARLFSYLLLCLVLCGPAGAVAATAQDLPLRQLAYQTWSAEGGLPQISVNTMVEDADGLLWIGTEKGLARFDGSRFEVFDRSNMPRLASSWVTRLLRDSKDRIWIATLRNLVRYEQGRFVEQPIGTLQAGRVEGLIEDAGGRVWLAGDSLMWEDKGAMVPVAGWEGRPSALLADGKRVWVAAQGGVLASFAEGKWTREAFAVLANSKVAAMAKAHGAVWLGTQHGLFRWREGRLEPFVLAAGSAPVKVTALSVDSLGRLVVGSDMRLFRIDAGDGVETFDTSASGFAGIISVYAARDGSLWVGSYQQGLRHWFAGRARHIGAQEGLRDLRTWSVLPTPEGVIVGHNAGFDILRDGRFAPYVLGEALPESSGYSLLRDRQGRVWLGTRGALARRELDGQLKMFPEFQGRQINGLLEDARGRIWVASSAGLFEIDGDTLRNYGEGSGLDEKKVRAVLFDRRSTMWVGTEKGLFRRVGERFERVSQTGLGQVFVSTMLALSDGRIAVGTYDDGLFIQNGDSWKLLDKRAGLPSLSVFFLAEYKGSLVASSSEGAYRIPLAGLDRGDMLIRDLEVLLLDQGDRLGKSRVRCCNGAGMGKGAISGDTLMLPSLAGVVVLPLQGEREATPLVRQLSFITSEGMQRTGQLAPAKQSEPITLPLGVREMEVRFSVVDFRRADALAYRYRLRDFDRDWIDAGVQGKASYNHLSPGRWKLEVQARHLYETWGPSTVVEVVVPARFVEGFTFRILLALLAIGALVSFIRLREERLVRQKRELEAIVAERTADLERTNRILAEASLTDTLTGLHNRRFLQDQIDVLIAGNQRARQTQEGDHVLGLALIDIDHFKSVNDNWGHAVGDQVLCRVAAALTSVGRASDILVRWGGEEFLVVLQGTQREELLHIGERLRLAIEQAPAKPGEPGRITASVGIIGFPLERGLGHDWHTALALADKALYAAKSAGRNRVATLRLIDRDLGRLSGRQLLDQLGALIDSKQIEVEFGPG